MKIDLFGKYILIFQLLVLSIIEQLTLSSMETFVADSLISCLATNDLARVEELLSDYSHFIDSCGTLGFPVITILLNVYPGKRSDFLELLLENGASLEDVDKWGNPAYHHITHLQNSDLFVIQNTYEYIRLKDKINGLVALPPCPACM